MMGMLSLHNMNFVYTKEIREKNGVTSSEEVDTGVVLQEKSKSYEVSTNISEWEDEEGDKNERYLCIDLDKPLVIKGDVRVNGYINCSMGLKVKGVYRVGDRYETT